MAQLPESRQVKIIVARFWQLRHNNIIMTQSIAQNEFKMITDAVAAFPAGAGIEEIHDALGKKTPRRTLQRRLALLVAQHLLMAEGRARARRYRLPVAWASEGLGAGDIKPSARKSEGDIPISPEGEAIRKAVRQPVQSRLPIGYNRDFLDSYRPNETFYLSADIRHGLSKAGKAPIDQHPAGTYALRIFKRLLLDLSWNSSRLEGNTYSLLETERLLDLGETAEGRSAMEAQMILNHKAAIELLVDQADEVGFNSYTILNLHALLSDNLLADPQACGRLRAIPVGIGGTVYHPLEVPQLVDECFRQILSTASMIADPFEQAFFVMVHLPYLQPFEDVNKRVSRLSANIPLIRGNLCPLSFVDVPARAYIDGIVGVYELNRVELLRDVFVWAYQRSCARYSAIRQSLGDPDPFRLKYRMQIKDLVSAVVRAGMDKSAAAGWIAKKAEAEILADDRDRFIEVVETELSSLHEGNFARYHLRPAEFANWRQSWR